MNRELYEAANKELDELLKKHPELLELQAELSFKLACMDNKEARCYYIFTEMIDSLWELREQLEYLNERLLHIRE